MGNFAVRKCECIRFMDAHNNQHKDGGVYLIGHGHTGDTDYTFEVFYNKEDYQKRYNTLFGNVQEHVNS